MNAAAAPGACHPRAIAAGGSRVVIRRPLVPDTLVHQNLLDSGGNYLSETDVAVTGVEDVRAFMQGGYNTLCNKAGDMPSQVTNA